MKKILIASKNPGKVKEFQIFLKDLPLKIVSLSDLGISGDVEEDSSTYIENSQKKALFYANKSKLPAIADDGGLEIAALNYEPGVLSRRWLGHEATDEELIEHMKKVSGELPDNNRRAWFRTVVSFALPNGRVISQEGSVEGIISKKSEHNPLEGYPFRSFFYLPKIKKYYHEMDLTPQEEKEYNHRYIAVDKLIPIIKKELELA